MKPKLTTSDYFLQRTPSIEKNLAIVALTILSLTAINSTYYSILFAFGGDTGTYIFRGDLLADYFKVLFSYPKGKISAIAEWDVLPDFMKHYVTHNPYKGVNAFLSGDLSHFHLPPFTTSLAFLNLDAFHVVGIRATFWIVITGAIAILYAVVTACGQNKTQRIALFAIALFSYPFIFALQRGNFFSMFSVLLVAWAVATSQPTRRPYLPTLLFALAVNIRPNLVLLAPLLYFLGGCRTRIFGTFIFFCLTIFAVSLSYAGLIYPDYTFSNFLAGLEIYKATHVIGDGGFGYSTSIYTALKLAQKLFDLNVSLEIVGTLVSLTGFLGATYFTVQRKLENIDDVELGFALTAMSMLTTPVFGDYHLLTFLVPILLISKLFPSASPGSECVNKTYIPIVLASAVMLSPLNYWNYGGLYVMSLAKTLIILAACSFLIFNSRGARSFGRSSNGSAGS